MKTKKKIVITCEVLQGQNAKGWVVELKISEIPNKEIADEYYQFFKKFYKSITLSLDSSAETVTKENDK